MQRIVLSIALLVVCVVSLGLKANNNSYANNSIIYPAPDDIVEMLQRNGFTTSLPPANVDPQWVTGVRGNCEVKIANVSPYGWHKSVVTWAATNRNLLFSVSGKLALEQPVTGPLTHHYVNRFKRYIGLEAPRVSIRAIISDPACGPNFIPEQELISLSN